MAAGLNDRTDENEPPELSVFIEDPDLIKLTDAGISAGPETELTKRIKKIRIFPPRQPAEKNRNSRNISRFIMPAGHSVRF